MTVLGSTNVIDDSWWYMLVFIEWVRYIMTILDSILNEARAHVAVLFEASGRL